MKICPNCGNPMDDDRQLCENCSKQEGEEEIIFSKLLPDFDTNANSGEEDGTPVFSDNGSSELVFETGDDYDDPVYDFDKVFNTSSEPEAHEPVETEMPEEKPAEVEESAEEIKSEPDPDDGMTMAQRIRKYQIIPDLQPIDEQEEEKPKRFRKHKKSYESENEITIVPAKAPDEPSEPHVDAFDIKHKLEREAAEERKPISHFEIVDIAHIEDIDDTDKNDAPASEPVVRRAPEISISPGPSKPRRRKKSFMPLIRLCIIVLLIIAVVVAAVLIIKNGNLAEKFKGKEPTEEVNDNAAGIKWVSGKKYSSDFEVLKNDALDLKDKIEASLKENCTSEYNKFSEHHFGVINGTENYIGYVDTLGVGLIFELTEDGNLVKSIYVMYDTSEDVGKSETLISEYTACVLNALGEINDLSYKNIGAYASSIRTNTFKSVASHARYNNFVLSKFTQGTNAALIINHGSDSDIEKFSKAQLLELVNCADRKFIDNALTEPTEAGEEDMTKFEEAVVYEVKTAGDPLRIRKEPNTDSEVLGTFESGTQIEVFGISGDWAKIKYNGEDAWLAVRFLEKVEQE